MTLSEAEALELEQLVSDQADDLEWLDGVDRTHPLATSMLWERPSAVWDQRRAVAMAMASPVGVILGGWRSGKSAGLKQLNVAAAMGGDHPAVQSWLEINGLPADLIPEGPAQTYLIAQSSNDSIRYHRDDIDKLVGPAGRWSNRNGKGEALCTISRPGSKAVGKIWCKSMDQGRRAFQGISIRRADIDEEPLGADGYAVFDELRARVADQAGRIGIAMLPAEGHTWVYTRLQQQAQFGARYAELDALDNPHLPTSFSDLYQGMTEDEVAVRRFGQFRARTGVIYGQWAPGNGDRWGPGNVVDDFEIPADWPRWRGADFGLEHPTCMLWAAEGDDGCLYVYREYYHPHGLSYPWHAERCRELEPREESVQHGWGDPSQPQAIKAFRAAGLHLSIVVNRTVKDGIDSIRDRLRRRGDNRPRLKVFRSCTNLIREFPGYVWDPNRIDEVPLKKDDHAMDALRYLSVGVERAGRI